MKALFLLFLSGPAWGKFDTQCPLDLQERARSAAPCTALESEKQEIAKLIEEGLAAADTAIKAEKSSANEKSAGNKEIELFLLDLAKDQRRLAENKFNESLALTAKYYNFRPKDSPDTKIQAGPIKGQPAPWRAKYYDDEVHFRKVPAPDGNHYLGIKPIDKNAGIYAGAVTKEDGEIAARYSLFRDVNFAGVELLAAILYHETSHFNALTSLSPPKTKIEHELVAAEAELLQLATFEITDDPKSRFYWYFKTLQSDIAQYKDTIANPTGKDPHLFESPYVTSDLEASHKYDYEKEERRQKNLKEYEDTLRQDVEKIKAQRKAEEEARRREIEEMERNARWSALKIWTLYACYYIRGVRYGDPEWGDNARISARDRLFQEHLSGHFVVLDRAELEAGLKKGNFFPGDVGTCQKQFVTMLRDLPGPVDLDWLLERIQYDKRGGRIGEFIRGVIGSLRGDSRGIVKSADKPSYGESSPDSRREREERGGGGVKDLDGEAWRQLRGIGVRWP